MDEFMQLDANAPDHGRQPVTHAMKYVQVVPYIYKIHKQLMTNGVVSMPIMSTTVGHQQTLMESPILRHLVWNPYKNYITAVRQDVVQTFAAVMLNSNSNNIISIALVWLSLNDLVVRSLLSRSCYLQLV